MFILNVTPAKIFVLHLKVTYSFIWSASNCQKKYKQTNKQKKNDAKFLSGSSLHLRWPTSFVCPCIYTHTRLPTLSNMCCKFVRQTWTGCKKGIPSSPHSPVLHMCSASVHTQEEKKKLNGAYEHCRTVARCGYVCLRVCVCVSFKGYKLTDSFYVMPLLWDEWFTRAWHLIGGSHVRGSFEGWLCDGIYACICWPHKHRMCVARIYTQARHRLCACMVFFCLSGLFAAV